MPPFPPETEQNESGPYLQQRNITTGLSGMIIASEISHSLDIHSKEDNMSLLPHNDSLQDPFHMGESHLLAWIMEILQG